MTILTSKDKKLLGLACLEEIQYFATAKVVPIVGKPQKEVTDALYKSSMLLIRRYKEFLDKLENADKSNTEQVEIDPKQLVTLCRDHIQTIRKYEVVKRDTLTGTFGQKNMYDIIVDIMMRSRDKYITDFEDLIYRLGGVGEMDQHDEVANL
jgi:hypothetical protein